MHGVSAATGEDFEAFSPPKRNRTKYFNGGVGQKVRLALNVSHELGRSDKSLVCMVCRKRTRKMCVKCRVGLCHKLKAGEAGMCFKAWHTQKTIPKIPLKHK